MEDKKKHLTKFAARLSQQIGVSKRDARRIRREIDDAIEAAFAMSGGFCLDEPDERAALADVIAVNICEVLPELAELLGKGK